MGNQLCCTNTDQQNPLSPGHDDERLTQNLERMSEGYVEEFMSTRLVKDNQSSMSKKTPDATKEAEQQIDTGVRKTLSTSVTKEEVKDVPTPPQNSQKSEISKTELKIMTGEKMTIEEGPVVVNAVEAVIEKTVNCEDSQPSMALHTMWQQPEMVLIIDFLEIRDQVKIQAVCRRWQKKLLPRQWFKNWDVYRMLMAKPLGCGHKEMAMWKKLNPLVPQDFISTWKKLAPNDPIDWAFKPLIEKNFKNADCGETMVFGQQNDANGKQHGIVRKIYNGGEIVTYTIKNGVEFGLCRVITDDMVKFTIDNEDGELASLEMDHDFNVMDRTGERKELLDAFTPKELRA